MKTWFGETNRIWHPGQSFPLTPALSLREREKPWPQVVDFEASCRGGRGRDTSLPLPWGEGRGEGEGPSRPIGFAQRFSVSLGVALLALLMGCGGKPQGDGHGHGKEASSGAWFKAGKGVILTDETRQSLGVETAEVMERKLPLEIRFVAHVFGESHAPTASDTNHAGCTGKASGLVPQAQAALLQAGQPVRLAAKSGQTLGAFVLGVNKSLALGEAEVVLGITNAGARLRPGDFLAATITLPRDELVAVVPKSALLRTAGGAFVYTLNGDAYFRTAVKTGAEAEGFVDITDGLLAGDVVVTKPVEKLWLIELRATKGGGHSH